MLDTEAEIWAYWQRGLLSLREATISIAASALASLAPPRYQALVAARVRRLLAWGVIAGDVGVNWSRLAGAIVSEVEEA